MRRFLWQSEFRFHDAMQYCIPPGIFPLFKWRRGEPWNSGELSADGRGILSATKGGGKGRKEGFFFSSHSWSCCNNEKPSGTLLIRYVSCGGGNSPFFAFLGAMKSN